MNTMDLKNHIKQNRLKSYYIFTGDEVKMMDIYLAQMAKVFGANLKKLDSAKELANKLNNTSFIKSRFIYVLRDCKEFIQDDTFKSVITQNKTISDDIITIFIYTNIDKRSTFYKSFADEIIEFVPMRHDVLKRYIQKDVPLSNYNCEKLISICNGDYSRILLELDKIILYGKCKYPLFNEGSYNANKAFEHLIEDGVIHTPKYDVLFEFIDAVMLYKPKTAFHLLSLNSEESALPMITLLYNNTKQLLQVQSYTGTKSVLDASGLTSYQVKVAKSRCGRYSNGDLVYLLRLLRSVERSIKVGEIEERIAIPYVLTKFWG